MQKTSVLTASEAVRIPEFSFYSRVSDKKKTENWFNCQVNKISDKKNVN